MFLIKKNSLTPSYGTGDPPSCRRSSIEKRTENQALLNSTSLYLFLFLWVIFSSSGSGYGSSRPKSRWIRLHNTAIVLLLSRLLAKIPQISPILGKKLRNLDTDSFLDPGPVAFGQL
jgi:hypothetical protein